MRLIIALVVGLVLGLSGGFVLANNMARATSDGMPVSAFDASPCAARVEKAVAFTAADAQDTLVVQSTGPSCENVIANVTIRNADGHIVFAHAERIDALMDPKVNPIAANGVKAVLTDYAAMADGAARAALPAWSDGSPDIANVAPYSMFFPYAGNMLYRRVRDANTPVLRLRSGRDGGSLFAYLQEIDEAVEIARYSL